MFPLLITYNSIYGAEKIPFTAPIAMITCLTTRLNLITIFKRKRLPIQKSPIRQFAIRNELLYSGFVLPNVQIFLVQKISFTTFGVSIGDFFTIYAFALQPTLRYVRHKIMAHCQYTCTSFFTTCPVLITVKRYFEPRHEISNNVVCATSKHTDQPAHMRNLIRVLVNHLNIL